MHRSLLNAVLHMRRWPIIQPKRLGLQSCWVDIQSEHSLTKSEDLPSAADTSQTHLSQTLEFLRESWMQHPV